MPPAAINEGPPVIPRPAATVLLVRDGEPWELLMVHRPGGADFAPGAYVFPGGAVQEEDRVWPDEIAGAAVRETFEETGILLAPGVGERQLARVRELVGDGAKFAGALQDAGVAPAFDSLVMFARWVTPAKLRRRFDTRFYVARMPSGQEVQPQEGEVTDWLWVSPQRALDTNEITLVYATRAVLESVAGHRDVIAWAKSLGEIPTVEPRIVRTESGWNIEL
jgi:recombination protein RecT